MDNLLLIIIFVGIAVLIYSMSKPKPNQIENQPILDDIDLRVMAQVNNGKINVWTFCQDEDYNFKMNWRYPQLSYNYRYPFQKLCIETLLSNMDKHDVNLIIINRKNAHLYVPDFPSRINRSPSLTSSATDLHPTTTGTPIAAATIELWSVRPPTSVAIPSTFSWFNAATSVGVTW